MIEVRPITNDDIPGFRETLDAVARERRHLAMLEAPSLERMRDFIGHNIAQDHAQFVATDDNRIVGWCDITPGAHGEKHVGRLGMGVVKDYRGRGLGRKLLEATLAKARTKNFEKIELQVYASNAAGCALYRKLGFIEEGCRRRARLVDGVYDDILLLALFLH